VQELPLALLRFGILAMLWLFVLATIRVIRSDIFERPPATPPMAPVPRRQPRPATGRRDARRSRAHKLVVTSGPQAGTTVSLDEAAISFGRADSCTLVLGDDYVSNQHARLSPDGNHWLLEDLGSTNGTFLAEQKVTHPTPVPVGAPIRLGRTVLELRR
jgi:Inner membrane component of T3SS, cytoplasmic domain